MPTLVRDLNGRAVGYLDGDRLRDDHGKPVAERTGDDAATLSLADKAARWMSGRQVLLDLAPSDVATPATQASFGIPHADYVADKISSIRYVTHDRGVWYPENAVDALSLVLPNAPGGSSPPTINPGFTPATFVTTGYALAARIPRGLNSNADFDLKHRALRRIVEGLRLARDLRVAQLLTTPANWPAANRIAATAKWNAATGANPLLDMMNALQKSYLPANVMVMPENASQYFYAQPQANTGIRDYVQAHGQMPEVLYARGKYLVAGVPAYVWAPATTVNVAVVRVSSDPDALPTTVTLRWLGDGAEGTVVEGIFVREFFDSRTDADWIVCAHNDSEVFVSNQIGALITGALA